METRYRQSTQQDPSPRTEARRLTFLLLITGTCIIIHFDKRLNGCLNFHSDFH